jgi:hypothetical protein
MTEEYSSKSNNEKPPIKADFVHDATKELLGKQMRAGQNPLMRSSSGLELVVRAEEGRALEYSIIDSRGFPLDEVIELRVIEPQAKKTTCWECGKDASGDTHCWKIPCPVITGPWSPGKVLQLGFVLQ